ncbi:uncharacterized protein LOC116263702 [Nymphaea colorata]|nr:uncharacterized protein LOC116263702 [Nymphaea colorata]
MADVFGRDIGGEGLVHGEHENPRETTHHMGVQPPTGREDDKKVIVEKLLSNHSTETSKAQKGGVSIISIILREVCKGSGENPDCSLSELCSQLRNELSKGKFLLVLDDVWELKWWEQEVEGTLMMGVMGSNILMTSRNKNVSYGMRASYMHQL